MVERTLMAIAFVFIAAWRALAGDPIVLDNGAKILLDPMPGTGAISVIAMYNTGFADDLPGVAQSTHLVEHLRVTAGTDTTAPGETQTLLNELGSANAETLGSVTYYDYAVPAGGLEIALHAEADRLSSLRITEADIAREIPRVRAEVEQVVSAPGIMLGKFAAMAGAQLWQHQHETNEISISIETPPTPDEMLALARANHRVSNLTLCISGDFNAEFAIETARKTIGALPRDNIQPAQDQNREFNDLPMNRRVLWDLPATVVMVALPNESTMARAELEAVAARATFALNQRPIIRSTFASGSTMPSGPTPLFVGVCVRADEDIESVVAEINEALDASMQTSAVEARETASFLSAPVPRPTPASVKSMAERTARMRGLPPERAHVFAAQLMGNAALQNRLRSLTEPDTEITDEDLGGLIRRVFSAENRRFLVITPR